MIPLFERYLALADALASGELAAVWNALLTRDIHHPWDGTTPRGHVPYPMFDMAFESHAEDFRQKGLYVWGAGRGEDARLQYVGVAGIRTAKPRSRALRKRFHIRYIAGPDARENTGDREINFAKNHEKELLRLPDDFNPVTGRMSLDKYVAAGIAVKESLPTRPQRAERYAKVGLHTLWYALLPAPHTTTGDQLRTLETALIEASNAHLFQSFAAGKASSRPLLNIDQVSESNPLVSEGQAGAYKQWLHGRDSWWNRWPTDQHDSDAQGR